MQYLSTQDHAAAAIAANGTLASLPSKAKRLKNIDYTTASSIGRDGGFSNMILDGLRRRATFAPAHRHQSRNRSGRAGQSEVGRRENPVRRDQTSLRRTAVVFDALEAHQGTEETTTGVHRLVNKSNGKFIFLAINNRNDSVTKSYPTTLHAANLWSMPSAPPT